MSKADCQISRNQEVQEFLKKNNFHFLEGNIYTMCMPSWITSESYVFFSQEGTIRYKFPSMTHEIYIKNCTSSSSVKRYLQREIEKFNDEERWVTAWMTGAISFVDEPGNCPVVTKKSEMKTHFLEDGATEFYTTNEDLKSTL